ncbi:competence type IV pilus minor pilin ComGD [Streptococcus plurextorum]|uniref:competence type IV pilus minor pilin ComGD n=1 Tax=Streptococcus plurextorum TaxID=456876 RepID=UPI0004089094|nr:competence type IV pilus minor pilin ComGD [Streptococcus plurextorum]
MITKLESKQVRAFTLLESLLTLLIVSFLVLNLSGQVTTVFEKVQEQLFFLSFEHLYRDSQRLSATQRKPIRLQLSAKQISNGYTHLTIPEGIQLMEEKTLDFDSKGGNSSLSKIRFVTDHQKVTYQLYMGSGNYQKKTD